MPNRGGEKRPTRRVSLKHSRLGVDGRGRHRPSGPYNLCTPFGARKSPLFPRTTITRVGSTAPPCRCTTSAPGRDQCQAVSPTTSIRRRRVHPGQRRFPGVSQPLGDSRSSLHVVDPARSGQTYQLTAITTDAISHHGGRGAQHGAGGRVRRHVVKAGHQVKGLFSRTAAPSLVLGRQHTHAPAVGPSSHSARYTRAEAAEYALAGGSSWEMSNISFGTAIRCRSSSARAARRSRHKVARRAAPIRRQSSNAIPPEAPNHPGRRTDGAVEVAIIGDSIVGLARKSRRNRDKTNRRPLGWIRGGHREISEEHRSDAWAPTLFRCLMGDVKARRGQLLAKDGSKMHMFENDSHGKTPLKFSDAAHSASSRIQGTKARGVSTHVALMLPLPPSLLTGLCVPRRRRGDPSSGSGIGHAPVGERLQYKNVVWHFPLDREMRLVGATRA